MPSIQGTTGSDPSGDGYSLRMRTHIYPSTTGLNCGSEDHAWDEMFARNAGGQYITIYGGSQRTYASAPTLSITVHDTSGNSRMYFNGIPTNTTADQILCLSSDNRVVVRSTSNLISGYCTWATVGANQFCTATPCLYIPNSGSIQYKSSPWSVSAAGKIISFK